MKANRFEKWAKPAIRRSITAFNQLCG